MTVALTPEYLRAQKLSGEVTHPTYKDLQYHLNAVNPAERALAHRVFCLTVNTVHEVLARTVESTLSTESDIVRFKATPDGDESSAERFSLWHRGTDTETFEQLMDKARHWVVDHLNTSKVWVVKRDVERELAEREAQS